jgi:rod shape determining protein RodA
MLSSELTLRHLDKIIIVCVLILVSFGLLAIYSATTAVYTPAILKGNFAKQVIWFAVGIMIASAVVMTPMQFFFKYAYWFYGIGLLLLVLVLFVGAGKGAHRWFVLGPLRLQPSEIAKVATILALARYAASVTPTSFVSNEKGKSGRRYKDLVAFFSIVLIPALLIIKEPDLGTALVFFSLALPMLFWAGLSPFLIFLLVTPIITLVSAFNVYTFTATILTITGILLWPRLSFRKNTKENRGRLWVFLAVFLVNITVGALTPRLWEGLHGYQRTRILTFVGIEQDPKGTGYQVNQSKVAIGSGGFWGKGWLHGTQTKLRFLPEQHTDFIFSVVGEEFGFVGVTLVLIVFLTLLWRGLIVAAAVKSKFTSLVVIGCVTVISVHVIINIGMSVGIMPVTGIPLPFLSYGGSALWANMILVALVLNAGIRRFQYL